MNESVYSEDAISVLRDAFRNKIAHMAHPNYVFVERGRGVRRNTWRIGQDTMSEHFQILEDRNLVTTQPRPWEVSFTHRFPISIRVFRDDLVKSMKKYISELEGSSEKQENFAQ